jgi:hypothetical protein
MINPRLKQEIERMVHKRSPQFFIKLIARLSEEKKKIKNDNVIKHSRML